MMRNKSTLALIFGATLMGGCSFYSDAIPLTPNDASSFGFDKITDAGEPTSDVGFAPDSNEVLDAQEPDAVMNDAAAPDAEETFDAGSPDAEDMGRDAEPIVPEAGHPDANSMPTDVGPRDMGFPDAAAPDAAPRDAAAAPDVMVAMDVTAPTDSGPPTGAEGGDCYGNLTCDPGLTCISVLSRNLCLRVPDGGTFPDAAAPDAYFPDAAPRDAAAAPDAGAMDTGFIVDSGMQDSGIQPDASTPVDAGPRAPNGFGTLPANTPSTINSNSGAMTVSFSYTLVYAPTEVTRAELRGVVGNNNPAAMISPIERAQYLNALSRTHGFEVCYDDATGALVNINRSCCRLPTEPEWRVLAQGPNEPGPLVGVNNTPVNLNGCQPQNVDQYIDQVAWYCPNTSGGVRQVRLKLPNGRGIYDVLGNVDEATEGCNWQFQAGMSVTNPTVQTAGCGTRTFMGGNWQGQGYQQTVFSGEVLPRDHVADTSGFRPVCRMP